MPQPEGVCNPFRRGPEGSALWELGPYNINVNSIAPGFIRSNPSTEKQWEAYGKKGQKALVNSITLKRLGAPDDIANAVLFFASDYANWITGQTHSVAGG